MYYLEFYNKKTNNIICYLKDDKSILTKNIEDSASHKNKYDLIKYANYLIDTLSKEKIKDELLNSIKKDYFLNIKNKDISFIIKVKVLEIRKMKINKIICIL